MFAGLRSGISTTNETIDSDFYSPHNNTAFGYETLRDMTSTGTATSSNNSAFGTSALHSNTTGNSNSAFGFSALGVNLTGNSNSAFGFAD